MDKVLIRALILLFGFFSLCIARNDPFTPVIVPKDSIRPYYGESSVFDTAQIEFPSTARLIKKIEVTFQNIDGSIETKSVAVSGRIDWRMPLLISQVLNSNQSYAISSIDNKMPPPSPANKIVKDITIPVDKVETKSTKSPAKDSKKTQDSKDSKQTQSSKKQANSHITQKSQAQKEAKKSTQTSSKKVPNPPYKIDGNSIFISYVGGLKRHFIMQNPYRIVLDFEINKKFYKRNRYAINKPYFVRLKYGLHTNFLRIVVELDGNYVYELEKLADGIKINVK